MVCRNSNSTKELVLTRESVTSSDARNLSLSLSRSLSSLFAELFRQCGKILSTTQRKKERKKARMNGFASMALTKTESESADERLVADDDSYGRDDRQSQSPSCPEIQSSSLCHCSCCNSNSNTETLSKTPKIPFKQSSLNTASCCTSPCSIHWGRPVFQIPSKLWCP